MSISASAALRADMFFEQWRALQRDNPQRHRHDTARQLHISEAELVDACCGRGAFRLEGSLPRLFGRLVELGPVQAISRNEHGRLHQHGHYAALRQAGPLGLVAGQPIDLRLFLRHWASVYAVRDDRPDGEHFSLQFFDHQGRPVHQCQLPAQADLGPFRALVHDMACADQTPGQLSVAPRRSDQTAPAEAVDRGAFIRAWRDLRHSRDFFSVLRRFRLSRREALHLAPRDLAWQVPARSLTPLLCQAAGQQLPLQTLMGNSGVIQAHTGIFDDVERQEQRLIARAQGVELQLQTDAVAEAWVVVKPTDDGEITALELFDATGNHVAQFFSDRPPQGRERRDWRRLVSELPRLDHALTA